MRAHGDSYLAGVGIGLVLLAAYALAGQGLGASGGFSSVAAALTAAAIGSEHASGWPAVAPYLPAGAWSPFGDWVVWELVGVAAGGFLSAWQAGRLAWTIERGTGISGRSRIVAAVLGGMVMGVGAKFARGCTSGQALSGGALLSVGSWIFIVVAFGAAYACAPAARRLWL